MDNRASLYTALSLGRHETRLLDLLPGQHHEPIVCHMRRVSLATPTPYEALSYVWGSSFDDREDVMINDMAFDVGHNLAQALKYLRLPDMPRTLWVDALCINQSDLEEKTLQVRLMREIYGAASRTVVWLGSFARTGRLAMDLIRRVVVEGTSAAFETGQEYARQSLRLVLQCAWWQRTWIIQELALSQGEPLLYCGDRSLTWSDLTAFWHLTTSTKMQEASDPREADKWQEFAAHIGPLRLIRHLPAEQRSWARLLLLTCHHLATDPRDRIFALHGLCSPESQQKFLPDYALDVPATFSSFTRFLIEHHGLDFLCFNKPRSRTDLPSWVPDYSSTCSLVDTCGQDFLPEEITDRVDHGLSQSTHFSGEGLRVLHIKTLYVGKVDSVVSPGQEIGMKAVFERSRLLYDRRRPQLLAKRDERDVQRVREGDSPPSSVDVEQYPNISDPNPSLPALLGCRKPGYLPEYTDQLNELLRTLRSGPLNFVPEKGVQMGEKERELLPMLDFMYRAVKQHCFFVTDNGFFGMGHREIQPEDQVFIAAGCSLPLLVRKSPLGPYRLVGSCKIPALLGSRRTLDKLDWLAIE